MRSVLLRDHMRYIAQISKRNRISVCIDWVSRMRYNKMERELHYLTLGYASRLSGGRACRTDNRACPCSPGCKPCAGPGSDTATDASSSHIRNSDPYPPYQTHSAAPPTPHPHPRPHPHHHHYHAHAPPPLPPAVAPSRQTRACVCDVREAAHAVEKAVRVVDQSAQ